MTKLFLSALLPFVFCLFGGQILNAQIFTETGTIQLKHYAIEGEKTLSFTLPKKESEIGNVKLKLSTYDEGLREISTTFLGKTSENTWKWKQKMEGFETCVLSTIPNTGYTAFRRFHSDENNQTTTEIYGLPFTFSEGDDELKMIIAGQFTYFFYMPDDSKKYDRLVIDDKDAYSFGEKIVSPKAFPLSITVYKSLDVSSTPISLILKDKDTIEWTEKGKKRVFKTK